MTLYLWRVLCIVAATLFVVGTLLLFFINGYGNGYFFSFIEDEFLKTEKHSGSVNDIYLTSGETKRYIKKYAVCQSAYEKYLVCNFAERFEEIKYFIVQFSKSKKVINVLEITQSNVSSLSSRVVALKARCQYVNVVISSVNGNVINSDYVRPVTTRKAILAAAANSVTLFALLFVLRHIVVETAGASAVYDYLNGVYNYVAIAACFALAVASFVITVLCYRSKKGKALNGGALEYEFL